MRAPTIDDFYHCRDDSGLWGLPRKQSASKAKADSGIDGYGTVAIDQQLLCGWFGDLDELSVLKTRRFVEDYRLIVG
jgi:hypothetical protein